MPSLEIKDGVMKICVTSQSEGLESRFEERFGRAPFFTFVDTNGVESLANPYMDGSGGVGPRAAQLVMDHGANVLITGRLGDNAANALRSGGMMVYTFDGDQSVAAILDEYQAGRLHLLQ